MDLSTLYVAMGGFLYLFLIASLLFTDEFFEYSPHQHLIAAVVFLLAWPIPTTRWVFSK